MPEAPYPRHLDDAELLGARLHVSDPRTEFSLLDEVPDGVTLAGIVASYDHRETRLRCARPACGVMHYKGFVVQLSNGHHIIIGHVCGQKLFGASWDAVEKEHGRLQARQRLLARRQAFLAIYPEVAGVLRAWWYRASELEKLKSAFSRAAPEMAAVLRERAQRSAPILSALAKIDQRAVEAMREAQAAAGRRGARPSDEREETIHTIQGLAFFDTVRPRELVEKGLGDLDSAAKLLSSTGAPDSTMRKALDALTSAIEWLRRFARLHAAARQALSRDNLLGIVRWHQMTDDFISMQMLRDALIVHREGRDPASFRLPAISPLDEAPLLRLQGTA